MRCVVAHAVQCESEEGGELAFARARLKRLPVERREVGKVSVLGEESGHARLRNPLRHRVATSALDASEDAHVVGAIVDFAKDAVTV